MITITWQIDWMNVSTYPIEGYDEIVLTAQWRCIGLDEVTPEQYEIGICTFPQPTPGGVFTPYADLTQDQVLGWCYENGVNKDQCEEQVTKKINNIENPSVETPPLPWNN
jgi:hypothetical protein